MLLLVLFLHHLYIFQKYRMFLVSQLSQNERPQSSRLCSGIQSPNITGVFTNQGLTHGTTGIRTGVFSTSTEDGSGNGVQYVYGSNSQMQIKFDASAVNELFRGTEFKNNALQILMIIKI